MKVWSRTGVCLSILLVGWSVHAQSIPTKAFSLQFRGDLTPISAEDCATQFANVAEAHEVTFIGGVQAPVFSIIGDQLAGPLTECLTTEFTVENGKILSPKHFQRYDLPGGSLFAVGSLTMMMVDPQAEETKATGYMDANVVGGTGRFSKASGVLYYRALATLMNGSPVSSDNCSCVFRLN